MLKRIHSHPVGNFVIGAVLNAALLAVIISNLPK